MRRRGRRVASHRKSRRTSQDQEIGGLVGRVLSRPWRYASSSRQRLIRLFQVRCLVVMPLVFAVMATTSLTWLYAGIFRCGIG